MKRLKSGTWVLIADGNKALVLRNEGDTQAYDLRMVWRQEQENSASRYQGDDRPGRQHESVGARGAAYETTNWHDLAEAVFAADVANIVNRNSEKGAFDEIVLVASPDVISVLRDRLSPDARAKVVAELDRTMTNHPIAKIETWLKTELDKV